MSKFSKQDDIQHEIPFDIKLPVPAPPAIGSMTKEQFDAEIQKGLDDIEAGRVVPLETVEAEMKQKLKV